MNIVEFLRARLDEDERIARAVKPLEVIYPMGGEAHPQKFTHGRLTYASEDGYPRGLSDPEAAAHFARHDPARVLREVEAKRRIVDLDWHHLGGWGMEEAKRQILVIMALPYADHPDYRQEWARG